MKSIAAHLVDALIARAMRTPFFHLPGYMERYWLVKPRWWTLGCSVRVHHILRSDLDRALHDHPWPFVTVILRGCYSEERPLLEAPPLWTAHEPTLSRWYGPGSILVRRATSRHRLTLPRHATVWTLFIMGPRRQSWGFYTREGKVHWSDYLPSAEATRQRQALATQHEGAE